jgi:hypothetical protein
MSRRRILDGSLALAVAFTVLLTASLGHADVPIITFTPGDLVVMRGGDAVHPQSTYAGGEVPVYLDEYTVAGAYVGTFDIPSDTITLPGITADSHEGRLELSADGHYLDFAGYHEVVDPQLARSSAGDAGVDGHDPTVRPPDPDYYQVGQVSGSGTFVHSAIAITQAEPQYVRVAYSNDGQEAWVGSKYNGSPGSGSGGGLEYLSNLGTASVSTTALQSSTDWRDLKIDAGQLYGGTGSSSVGVHGVYAIGSGEPTADPPSNTLLTGNANSDGSSFSFQTLPGVGTQPINGVVGSANTLYDVGAPGGTAFIGKLYSPSGTTPLALNNLVFASRLTINNQIPEPEGITTQIDPTDPDWVDLYVQNANGIYFAIDKSGTSSGDFGALSFTKIISTAADGSTNFYGLSFAPSPVLTKGDLNVDGHVDVKDVVLMEQALANLPNYLAAESSKGVNSDNLLSIADINGDGQFNNADIQALIIDLQQGQGSLVSVPEPSGFLIAVLSAAGWASVCSYCRHRAGQRRTPNCCAAIKHDV